MTSSTYFFLFPVTFIFHNTKHAVVGLVGWKQWIFYLVYELFKGGTNACVGVYILSFFSTSLFWHGLRGGHCLKR